MHNFLFVLFKYSSHFAQSLLFFVCPALQITTFLTSVVFFVYFLQNSSFIMPINKNTHKKAAVS